MNDRELAIAAYHEAILRAAEYGDPEIDRLLKRRLAKEDLFFLLVYVLGRADLNRDWYFTRCREVQAAPNGCGRCFPTFCGPILTAMRPSFRRTTGSSPSASLFKTY